MYLDQSRKNKKILENYKVSKSMQDLLAKDSLEEIDNLRNEYREYLEGIGIPTFSDEELLELRKEIDNITIEPKSHTFLDVLFSSINSSVKIDGEVQTNHYENSVFGATKNNLSFRFLNSMDKYSRTLSSITDKDSVDIDIIGIVLPYTLEHRIKFEESYIQSNLKDEFYPGSQQKYASKIFSEELIKHFLENEKVYKEFYSHLIRGNSEEITKISKKIDSPAMRSISYHKTNSSW